MSVSDKMIGRFNDLCHVKDDKVTKRKAKGVRKVKEEKVLN